MSTENLDQARGQALNSPAAANTVTVSGLTSQEAAARLAQWGPNDPAPPKRHSALLDLLRLFLNPLVLILLVAAIASSFLGDVTDAAIIVVIVAISNALDFTQSHKSQQAIKELRARVAPTATVLRDGAWQETRRADIVHPNVHGVHRADQLGL